MNVKEVYAKELNLKNNAVFNTTLTGWLIILDDGLYLLEDDYPDQYYLGLKVKISNPDLEFALINAVAPLGGGGIYFHECKVEGLLHITDKPIIQVSSMFISEYRDEEMKKVDISQATIARQKLKHTTYFTNDPDSPWADLYS